MAQKNISTYSKLKSQKKTINSFFALLKKWKSQVVKQKKNSEVRVFFYFFHLRRKSRKCMWTHISVKCVQSCWYMQENSAPSGQSKTLSQSASEVAGGHENGIINYYEIGVLTEKMYLFVDEWMD